MPSTRSGKSTASNMEVSTSSSTSTAGRKNKRKKEETRNDPAPFSLTIQTNTNKRKKLKHHEMIANIYEFGELLGSGAFAEVKKGRHKETQEIVAIKIIPRHHLHIEEEERIHTEKKILQSLYHPNIMRLKGFYEEEDFYYFVVEYIGGGELFDRISKKTNYDEKTARNVMKTILYAVKYCHEKNIVHRDLKPENLILQNQADDTSLKLIDFGLAAISVGNDLRGVHGTIFFIAPEILNMQPYGKAVDMWSIGVILFCLLGGYYPFQDDNETALKRLILKGSFCFNPKYGWNKVSTSAKDLICRLLTINPNVRLTVEDALNHDWMLAADEILERKLLKKALSGIQSIQAKKRWKKGIHAVLAINRMKWLVRTPTSARNKLNVSSAASTEMKEDIAPRTAKDIYTIYDKEIQQITPYYIRKKAINNDTKEIVSVKIIHWIELTEAQLSSQRNEMHLLSNLQHPTILSFHDHYEDLEKKKTYIFTEYLIGNELFDRISYQRDYSEAKARDLVRTLLSAIQYFHQEGILHRDLRPEHLFLTNDSYNAEIKIVNFSSATSVYALQEHPEAAYHFLDHFPHQRFPFTSPELIQRLPYDQSCDIWSFGMIVSFLLIGHSPFPFNENVTSANSILDLDADPAWSLISVEAKDFVRQCLAYNPSDRITAAAALYHPWFQVNENILSSHVLPNATSIMRKYQVRKKFRVTVKALLLIIRMKRALLDQQQRESKKMSISSSVASSMDTEDEVEEFNPYACAVN